VLEGDTERLKLVNGWLVVKVNEGGARNKVWSLPPKLLVDGISHRRMYVKIAMVAYHD